METSEIIIIIVLFLIAISLFVISFFHLKEKGPLLNNAILFATKEEREKIDKKPYYRQSGIVFALLGIIFLLIGLATFLETGWLYYIVWGVAFIDIVYAVASSIKAERNNHK